MLALAAPALLAMLLAVALSGSVANWSRERFDWWPVAMISLTLQVALFAPPLDEQPLVVIYGPWLYVASMVGVLLVLLRLSRTSPAARWSLLVAALGVGLNVLVVSANGGYMPRSPEASTVLGRPLSTLPSEERLVNVREMTADTRLPWLGDVVPQPSWLPLANVVSVGDLLLAGGLAVYAFQVTAGGWRRPGQRRTLTPISVQSAER